MGSGRGAPATHPYAIFSPFPHRNGGYDAVFLKSHCSIVPPMVENSFFGYGRHFVPPIPKRIFSPPRMRGGPKV